MAWRVVCEDAVGTQIVDVHRKMESALEQARIIAKAARFMGVDRPNVHVVRTESSDQLQVYANGTKAVRDQPWLGATGEDRILFAPCATATAPTRRIG